MPNHDYQPYMVDAQTKEKLAKLAEYEALQEQCGYNIPEAIHGLSGEILRLKDELAEKEKGCHICDDTSNDRYYRNQGYKYCPYCGTLINSKLAKIETPYITDEEFVNYTEGTSHE